MVPIEVLGREVQLGELLKFIKDEDIKNVVFITADVHFAAAISYDPAQAKFRISIRSASS
ncbi:MAG: alkaline phosphatase D family protein [Woeseiaceae bacterium]